MLLFFQNLAPLFLKAHLEYQRGNFNKAITILNSIPLNVGISVFRLVILIVFVLFLLSYSYFTIRELLAYYYHMFGCSHEPDSPAKGFCFCKQHSISRHLCRNHPHCSVGMMKSFIL